MQKEIQSKRREYQEKFVKSKGGVRSLQWNSYLSAASRYVNLVADIDFSKKSVLDIGCGFGDIIPMIASKTLDFKYTGIDIVPEFIREGKKRYPEGKFLLGDYFSEPLDKMFDIVLCCGALNSKYKNAVSYRKKAIKRMFDHSKFATVFNMAGGTNVPNKKESKIYYADSLEILKYCMTLTPKVVFRQQYHYRDFSIVMFK
jgi:SAM-dependent methyltransferase